MPELSFRELDKKWQAAWEAKKAFEPEPKEKKVFVTVPYPYVNGAPHIGHAYSTLRADVYARFKRAQGFNVLFPMAFHATGEPILGAVERLNLGDPVQLNTFKNSGATEAEIERMKKDPQFVAEFWAKRFEDDYKLAGMSIDWSRKFFTAITPTYNSFIEWQYKTLRKQGYVVQGTHPVIWCPHDQSPTGDHDRLEGEGESPMEYTLIKFKLKDALSSEYRAPIYLVCATLRPETLYGVTNLWASPDTEYALAMAGNELWVVSTQAVTKLADQLHDIRQIGHVPAEQLLGKRVEDPLGGADLPILPAHFVDTEIATGIVMSVPAHAPYDYAGVQELLKNPAELERFHVQSTELEPVPIIETPGLHEVPAKELVNQMKIGSANQRKELDEATQIIYKKEFHLGKLKAACGEFAGKMVSAAKDELIASFKKRAIASSMWEPTATVVCRCTTKCHIKILENQWFLKYSDPDWKAKVRKLLSSMSVMPDEARTYFDQTIDALHEKACARKSGLGTPLPWDPSWIVETLSDSTIYMAFYTISKAIRKHDIRREQMTEVVFDHIFLGKGDSKKICKATGIAPAALKEMRKEFESWYPVDLRITAKEHIPNHLTFFLFHHTALFPQKLWPRALGINGMIIVEGQKMSKSKGNVLSLKDTVEKFGADLTRINAVASSEGLEDPDWRHENLQAYRGRYQFLHDLSHGLKDAKGKSSSVDKWLIGEVNKSIRDATYEFDRLKFRSGVQSALFNTYNALKWYIKRTGGVEKANKKVLKWALEEIARMLAPLTPHACEELWSILGHKKFIHTEGWPKSSEKEIYPKLEAQETMIRKAMEDIQSVKKLAKIPNPRKVTLFIAKDEHFKNAKEKKDQLSILGEAKDFIGRELHTLIEVADGNKSDNPKADKARSDRLGILIE